MKVGSDNGPAEGFFKRPLAGILPFPPRPCASLVFSLPGQAHWPAVRPARPALLVAG